MPLFNPQQTGSISGGTTRATLGEVVFSNLNGVSFGVNGQTLTASHNGLTTQSGQAFSAGGGSSTFQTLSFSNANGISFSNNAGQVQGSYTVPTVTNSSMSVSDAATSGTLARLAFTNLNGVTLSLSTGAGGSHTIVGSHNALTSQSGQAFSAEGGSSAFQTLSFSNANGFSFSNNAGQVQGSYTVPTVTNSSLTLSDNATSMTIGRLAFTQSNGITMSLSTTTGGSATLIGSYTVPTVTNSSMSVSDAATSGTLARLAFTNLNGVTLSLSTGAGGSHTIVGSHNALTSQSNQAVSGSNGSFAFQTVTFGSSNGLHFYTTNGSLVGSYTVPVGGAAITISDNASSATIGQLAFTNLNGITLSLSTGAGASHTIVGSHNALTSQSNQQMTFFATGNTTQSSTGTMNASSLIFQGTGDVSVGISNGSVVISGGGPAGATLSFLELERIRSITNSQLGSNQPFIIPFAVQQDMVIGRWDGFVSLSISSSSNSSHAGTLSMIAALYTRNVSTLSLASSGIGAHVWTNTSNNSTASLSGIRQVSAELSATLTPGDYWLLIMSRTSTANANWWTGSNVINSVQSNTVLSGRLGAATTATFHPMLGMGLFSATTTAPPTSIGFSEISGGSTSWRWANMPGNLNNFSV